MARPRRQLGRRYRVCSAAECDWHVAPARSCTGRSATTCPNGSNNESWPANYKPNSHVTFLFVTCLILPSVFSCVSLFFLLRFLLDYPYTTLTTTRIRKPHLARVDRRKKGASNLLNRFGCFLFSLFFPYLFSILFFSFSFTFLDSTN
jgi:hypothetical protein